MTKLDGEIMSKHGSALTQNEKCSILTQMGAVIHRIPMDAFGYIGPHGVFAQYSSNRAYVSFEFDKKIAEFSDQGGDPELAMRMISFVAERTHLLDACREACLCHYDFHGGNVLVERKGGSVRLTGVLDFEGAIAGDPLMDFAKALYYAWGEGEREALSAGYGVIQRADCEETLALYRLYCVLELCVWFAQIGNNVPLVAGLTQELERLTRASQVSPHFGRTHIGRNS
jgi:aminoglycoside phosphotransferase (APT) family kinase protein